MVYHMVWLPCLCPVCPSFSIGVSHVPQFSLLLSAWESHLFLLSSYWPLGFLLHQSQCVDVPQQTRILLPFGLCCHHMVAVGFMVSSNLLTSSFSVYDAPQNSIVSTYWLLFRSPHSHVLKSYQQLLPELSTGDNHSTLPNLSPLMQ